MRVRLFFNHKKTKKTIRKQFYQGMQFTLWTAVIKNICTYPTQEFINDQIRKKKVFSNENHTRIASSFITGSLIGLICNPINTIKIPLQTQRYNLKWWQVGNKIYHQYGFQGFYRGGTGIFLREVSWASFYFPIFYHLNDKYDNKILASVIGGIVSMTMSYPFDGMRLYRQKRTKKKFPLWYGFFKSFNLNQTNLRSFGTGLVRVPISVSFCHLSYLYLKDIL